MKTRTAEGAVLLLLVGCAAGRVAATGDVTPTFVSASSTAASQQPARAPVPRAETGRDVSRRSVETVPTQPS
ncbi:MAG: hypothetical protein M3O36_02540, partial [Myxococcota bacterium]|nr:hypothetical protein [Myxococcota bacterium]